MFFVILVGQTKIMNCKRYTTRQSI